MINLDATTKSLEIKLAGAVATNQLPFVASYVDLSLTTFELTGAGESDGLTNGATAVTVAAAPAASTTRKLNFLSVVNVDTAAVTLTIQVNNNGTKRQVQTYVLAVGDQVSFTDAGGWKVFDANGNQKTIGAPAAAGTLTGTVLAANVVTSSLTTVGALNAGSITSGFGSIDVGTDSISGGVASFNGGAAQVLMLDRTSNGAGCYLTVQRNAASQFYFGSSGSVSGVGDKDALDIYVAGNQAMYFHTNAALRATLSAAGLWQWHAYGAGTLTTDASGNITAVSDGRFKDRIAPLGYGLAEVLALRPVRYGYNRRSGLERKYLYAGFIAQDIERVIPLAVGRDARGYRTLSDRPILSATVNAIKEIHARLATLERKAR